MVQPHLICFEFLQATLECLVSGNGWFSGAEIAFFTILNYLQMIPESSVSQRVPTILGPLGFVVASTMLREGIEDLRRHKADNEMNSTIAYRLSTDGSSEIFERDPLHAETIVFSQNLKPLRGKI